MKLTEEKVSRINDELRAKTAFFILNSINGVVVLNGDGLAFCSAEEIDNTIKSLSVIREEIKKQTGVIV